METIVQGLNHATVYIDDIQVTGTSYTDHHNLQKVLKRLHKAEARLHKDKCSFMSAQVKYLGYVIDERGLHPILERVKAIVEVEVVEVVLLKHVMKLCGVTLVLSL